jgi:hypothetical protein
MHGGQRGSHHGIQGSKHVVGVVVCALTDP